MTRAPVPTSLRASRLEHLHKIAGGVFDQDLPAARPGDDVAAEPDAGLLECLHLSLKIAASYDDPVPATGFRPAPVRHGLGPTARAFRRAQHKLQGLSPKERKVRTRLCGNAKPQVLRIEGNRRVDGVDDVADHNWVEFHDVSFMVFDLDDEVPQPACLGLQPGSAQRAAKRERWATRDATRLVHDY